MLAKANVMLCEELSTQATSLNYLFSVSTFNNFTLFNEKSKNNRCMYEFMIVFYTEMNGNFHLTNI
jgi:hypothetical protein